MNDVRALTLQANAAARLAAINDPYAPIVARMKGDELQVLALLESSTNPTAISTNIHQRIHNETAQSVDRNPSYTPVIPQADMPKMASVNWTDKALCRGSALFSSDSAADQRRAAKICAACPVIEQCRQAGQGEPWGVWGGLTPAQRRVAA